ncbi:glycosyltransferase family 4 protein [Thioclava sp. BHET1]|nr:glycosyltransferase family 4 protein [Thioclava sp. BHET1]
MSETRILHLTDDTSPGGVSRLLAHIQSDPALARLGRHEILPVSRRGMGAPALEGDVIVSHLSISWRRLPALIALRARYPHLPLIHVEHSYSAGFTAGNVVRRMRFQTLLRTAYALFDRVVAVSRAQGQWLVSRGLVEGPNLVVIPSTVALERFLILPVPRGPVRVVGAIGRFDRQKGFDLLIRAFRATQAPELELRMIGDGPDYARLVALAAGDPRIHFTRFAEDPVAAMAGLDAVAMPSRWEPYGLVALEARAAARPLLVTPVDGLRDHIAAGAQAVAPSVEAWSEALEALAKGDGRTNAMRGRRLAAQADQAFSDSWRALLAGLVAERADTEIALAV